MVGDALPRSKDEKSRDLKIRDPHKKPVPIFFDYQMNPGKARIKDIAHLAGVSIGTVDRVLHDRGEVSEKTRKKIKDLLRETHYSPNMMARALKACKSYHIVSLLPEPDEANSYWEHHPAGMTKAVAELEPFRITVTEITFSMQSETDFQKKTEKVLALKPDGIVMAPIFKTESVSFCKKLMKNSIPFVFIDGYIENTGFLAYIGENVFQSGKVAGQLIDMVTPEAGDILVVNIARNIKNVHHLKNRTAGFLNYFETVGRNRGKKITISIHEPVMELVRNDMDIILKEYPSIASVFISGSKSFLIASYIEERNLNGINIIGYDLLDANVRHLKSGITRFLIGQRPEEQTYIGTKKLFEYLALKKIPEQFEYLPIDIVTSENVEFFLKN
jgi:LacI family transcriptional regulator